MDEVAIGGAADACLRGGKPIQSMGVDEFRVGGTTGSCDG